MYDLVTHFMTYRARSLRERPFDIYGRGQEDVFGSIYIFCLRRDPVFLLANNTKRIVELFLSWIIFSGILGPGIFFFEKSSSPTPNKNRMVAP